MRLWDRFLTGAVGAGALLGVAGTAWAGPCSGTFSYTGAVESCTVDVGGIYAISATGAQGGGNPGTDGALGASISISLSLTAGHVLQYAVGGTPGVGVIIGGGGGGGGSFVYDQTAGVLLLAAGGGGGAGSLSGLAAQSAGQTGMSGGAGGSSGSGDGGSSGGGSNGGAGGSFSGQFPAGGGGGGGITSNGTDGATIFGFGSVGGGGRSWLNGLAGGLAAAGGSNGGFGGGGGGSQGGGGGGGYSGGGGGGGSGSDGSVSGGSAGGGGGSFFIGPATLLSAESGVLGDEVGHGLISFNFLQENTTVPEPASLALLGAGLLGLAAARRRKAA